MKDVISVNRILEEQLMEVMLYVRTTHEVEHNDNQWTREFVYSFDEAKQALNLYIEERVREGKIKEIKHLAGDMIYIDMNSRAIQDRIKELENTPPRGLKGDI